MSRIYDNSTQATSLAALATSKHSRSDSAWAACGTSRRSFASAMVLAAVLGAGPAQAQSNIPPCPDSILAPFGLAPEDGKYCSTTDCLLTFKNYKWWVAYQFSTTGYYNGGLQTILPPNNVSLGNDGLHLKVSKQDNCRDINGHIVFCGAEVVAMFDANGKQANLGFGSYLVDAQLIDPPLATFADYDPNVALGMFTYERPGSGTDLNPSREIDLAEISRWGWDHIGTCPIGGYNGAFPNDVLCEGNAQFALQLVKLAGKDSVKRYTIGSVKEVTLVMRWSPGSVKFEEYNLGGLTLTTLPKTVDNEWASPDALADYVPTETTISGDKSCQRFHINLWLGNYGKAKLGLNPGPSQPVEVVIKNFQYCTSLTKNEC